MQIYGKKGNLPQAESLLRKVISLNPNEPAYRAQLIQFLVAQRRFDEAEKEFRARVEANPTDSKAGLDLVRFLNVVKGPDAARTELDARIKAGGDTFDYQIALAQLNFAQNKIDEATQALQALANTASTPEQEDRRASQACGDVCRQGEHCGRGAAYFRDSRKRSPKLRRIATSRVDQYRQGADSTAPSPTCVKLSMISQNRPNF